MVEIGPGAQQEWEWADLAGDQVKRCVNYQLKTNANGADDPEHDNNSFKQPAAYNYNFT